jgi:hypothetical protein
MRGLSSPQGSWPRVYTLGVPNDYRGASLESQLNQLGMNFSWIEGLDPSAWSPIELARAFSSQTSQLLMGRDTSPGEVACVMGRQRSMQAFLQSGERWAFIFEDDLEIELNLRPSVEHLENLGTDPCVVLLESQKAFESHHETCRTIDRLGGFLFKLDGSAPGPEPYLISRSAAQLTAHRYRNRLVDSVANWLGSRRDVLASRAWAIHSRNGSRRDVDYH